MYINITTSSSNVKKMLTIPIGNRIKNFCNI